FSGADVAGGVADQKSGVCGGVEFGESPLHHTVRRLPAEAFLGRAVRAVINLRNLHPERRQGAEQLLIYRDELLRAVIAETDSLLIGDDGQGKAGVLQLRQALADARPQL